MQLDHQFHLEDAILAVADAPPATEHLVIFLAAIRAALPEATTLFGQAYAAAQYGCTAVGNALHVDEDVPGLTPAQMKAIRAASAAETQVRATQAALPTAARNNVPHQTLQLASARATAAAIEAASEPAAVAAANPPAHTAAPAMPFDARQVYCCNSCNVLGHWSQDNKCKPADVQANLARLTALLAPPPSAAAEPVAGPSTGKTDSCRSF